MSWLKVVNRHNKDFLINKEPDDGDGEALVISTLCEFGKISSSYNFQSEDARDTAFESQNFCNSSIDMLEKTIQQFLDEGGEHG